MSDIETIVNIFNPHRLAWWHYFGCNFGLCAELPIVWTSEAFSNDWQKELFQICFFHRSLDDYDFFIITIFSPSSYMQLKPILNYYMHQSPNLKTLFASCATSYRNWTILEMLPPNQNTVIAILHLHLVVYNPCQTESLLYMNRHFKSKIPLAPGFWLRFYSSAWECIECIQCREIVNLVSHRT